MRNLSSRTSHALAERVCQRVLSGDKFAGVNIGIIYRTTLKGALKVASDCVHDPVLTPGRILVEERQDDAISYRGTGGWKTRYIVEYSNQLKTVMDVSGTRYYQELAYMLKYGETVPAVVPGEKPNDTAFEWFRLGFAPLEAARWWKVLCHDPVKTDKLRQVGFEPHNVDVEYDGIITLGHAYCNGDISLQEVKRKANKG